MQAVKLAYFYTTVKHGFDTLGACSIKTLWMLKLKLACLFVQASVLVQARRCQLTMTFVISP
jgi:hypothetical protein